MANWETFEYDCTNFLNKKYSKSNLSFKCIGGANSTTSDIQIIKNNTLLGYIEAKMNIAQSGQFVLLNDDTNKMFIYSPLSKTPINASSQLILNYINANYDYFKDVSTSSLGINLNSDIFNNWIIEHYSNKNAQFMITSLPQNEFIIFPTKNFGDYFNVKANFRRKKSGSRELPSSDSNIVSNYLNATFDDIKITNLNKKYFVTFSKTIPPFKKYKFSLNSNSYQLTQKYNNTYEIRKLGKTNNPTVIFSIEFKCTSISSSIFENYIYSL